MILIKTEGYHIKEKKHITDRDKERIVSKYNSQMREIGEEEAYQSINVPIKDYTGKVIERVSIVEMPYWGWYIVDTTNEENAEKIVDEILQEIAKTEYEIKYNL